MKLKSESLNQLRQNYCLEALDEERIAENPFEQFEKWFEDALRAELIEPNAMTLSTVSRAGVPSARMVLLKAFDEQGFVFFSNYKSRKANELAENAFAALLFWWDRLARQIRIEGEVEKISAHESDQYFKSRPQGSQVSAWVSKQSAVIPDRKFLEDSINTFRAQKSGEEISRPPFWGGYRVKPFCFEFWQGRSNRLHDRISYRCLNEETWTIERLSP